MCLLCVISKWSRRIATMLPWIVIPFIIIWALSQLFPPTYRLEVTSPRLACVGVLLGSLGWYEVIMPWLSMWRARRSALLRERQLIQVQEAAKLRKEATRRCRNCLTVYKVQNPGNGRFMCTYCGHVSKRPVLEVPGMLMGPMNSASSSKAHSGVQFMNKDGMLYVGLGHGSVEENMRKGCAIGNGCHYFSGTIFRVLSAIGRVLKFLFGFGWSENADIPKGPYQRIQRKDNIDNLHVSKAEKARKKADERRQARLVKELLEAEERKQREEVAHMVEERRRHREEKVQIEKESEREAAAEREREMRRTRESERRRRDKDKGGVMETPLAEEVSPSTRVVDSKDVHQTAPKLLDIGREAKGVCHDHGLRNRAGIDLFTNLGSQRYLGVGKKIYFSTSKKDCLWRGKRDTLHRNDKSMRTCASVDPSGSSSNSNTSNILASSVSAWTKPLFNAWSKSMETLSAGDTMKWTRTVPDESGKPEQEKTSGVMSWTSNMSAVKPFLAPVGSTCMQRPIAPPSTHIDSLHQLFSSPSIFPPIDLSMDFKNQHENDSITELKASFISDHTFFENAACIGFQTPISLAEQDLFPSSANSNLENMDTHVVTPTLPSQVCNPESLLQMHAHDPQWKLPILLEDIVDNSGDNEAKQNDRDALELDEMKLSKLSTWVPDTLEKKGVHLPYLSTLQSLFENEEPEEEGPFSPLKDVFKKVDNGDGLASPQHASENFFSDYLACNRALQIWEDGDSPQKVPPEFVDCITQEIMKDPVITADGHSYERAAIEKWLMYHDTSPKTGEVLPPLPGVAGVAGMDKMAVDKTLRPNHILRGQIIDYRERLLKMASRASIHDYN